MTATLALTPTEQERPAVAAEPMPVVGTTEEPSVGDTLKVVLPTTVLVVLLGSIAAFVIGGTPVGEAIGYGAYLAFWIGGGFGAILSGAVWSQKTGH
jgi:hypothetical protein